MSSGYNSRIKKFTKIGKGTYYIQSKSMSFYAFESILRFFGKILVLPYKIMWEVCKLPFTLIRAFMKK